VNNYVHGILPMPELPFLELFLDCRRMRVPGLSSSGLKEFYCIMKVIPEEGSRRCNRHSAARGSSQLGWWASTWLCPILAGNASRDLQSENTEDTILMLFRWRGQFRSTTTSAVFHIVHLKNKIDCWKVTEYADIRRSASIDSRDSMLHTWDTTFCLL